MSKKIRFDEDKFDRDVQEYLCRALDEFRANVNIKDYVIEIEDDVKETKRTEYVVQSALDYILDVDPVTVEDVIRSIRMTDIGIPHGDKFDEFIENKGNFFVYGIK